ncbi:TonB-dependent receptor [Shewanella gaetbuli]|uniref:TonB-dependent receptor n=1 Tax=Shewanella gaetbuli TaxID=220752 RepID=A0A9X1ZP33_9GAMM|nr:TonB-dependent receptor [Shewanella gaetbuli]MCL1141478.1 TonB-dependent receptor [Shewanella gaetbuli]
MSKRSFSISLVASAVAIMLGSASSYATTTNDAFTDKHSVIDLKQQNIAMFHYRDTDNALAQAGVTVHPDVPHADNPISIRGALNGVAVMQDNIFYSAAPYSGQNLTALPNVFFHDSLTVRKYSSVTDGGQGAFGAVNYTSAQISPRDTDAVINLETDQDGSPIGGLLVSGTTKDFGLLLGVDYQKHETEAGLNSSLDNKHDKLDVLFKVDANSLAGARRPQKTEFSYHYTDTTLDNSHVGTTDADYAVNPEGRYSATQLDNEQGKRQRYALAHQVKVNGQSSVFTDFYYQSYAQQAHNTLFIGDEFINRQLLTALSAFEKAPSSAGILTSAALPDNDFAGFGVQSKGVTMYGAHEVTYQARYHSDKAEMRVDGAEYLLGENLALVKTDTEYAVGTYRDDADVFTTAVNTKLNYNAWSIGVGLGYEKVSVSRELGEDADLLNAADFSNDGWLPELEIAYANASWLFALSAKQAWTAASAGNAQQLDQEALQYQLAFSYTNSAMTLGASAYMHDFDNQHVTCRWGVACSAVDETIQVNIKDVSVQGADVTFNYDLQFDSFSMPIGLEYNYTKAEFGQNHCDLVVGCYVDGQQLPWVPEQQIYANIGFEMNSFHVAVNGVYQSETGSPLTPGNYGIESQWKVDLAAQYQITPAHQVYVRIENLTDEQLVAKHYQTGNLSQGEMRTYFGYQGHF